MSRHGRIVAPPMASSVVIPQDIIHSIIEAVGDDTPSLKMCSLVSSEFSLPSRKRLFSRISISPHLDCDGLHRFLVENPVLQSFVRIIYLDLYCGFDESYIISTLRLPFCSLESFSISRFNEPVDWDDFSSELLDEISTIIHSPTLKTLHLTRINVPVMHLQGAHLTKLVMKNALFEINQPISPQSHTVIDQIVWMFDEPVYDLPDPMFLPFLSHIRVLETYVNPYTRGHFNIMTFLIGSLRESSSSPTLEHLKFTITILFNTHILDNDGFHDELFSDELWRCLDSMPTRPFGSRLQRVDVNVSFRDDKGIVDGSEFVMEMEPIIRKLPLLQRMGILFTRIGVEGGKKGTV